MRIPRLPRLVLVAGILGLLVALPGCVTGDRAEVAVGDPAPAYTQQSLTGSEVDLAELRGEVVLANVWATWCRPCRAEMPFLQQLSDRYSAQGLRVVGINVDRGADESDIRTFLGNVGVTFPTLLDPADDFGRTFATSGVPESVLIRRDGVLLHRWRGPLDTAPEDTRGVVQAALAGTRAAPTVGLGMGVGIALLAGLLSFASPCVFPLIPTYVAFVTGVNVDRGPPGGVAQRVRRRALLGGGLFVVGFSLVFITLGASATLAGAAVQQYSGWIARVGGALVIVFGLHLLGVLRIPLLNREARALTAVAGRRRGGAAGVTAFLGGVTFAAGWTPCIGPVLGSILTVAAARDSVYEGIGLLAAYSAGLAIPFLTASVALDRFLALSHRFRRWLPWVERASGVLLLAVGLLLVTGSFRLLAGWLPAFDLVG